MRHARMMQRAPSRAPVASPLQIRSFEPADWPALWQRLEPVFRTGETFPHDPAITEEEAQVVGTLPGAVRHQRLGYVDALVMVQMLLEGLCR